MSDRAMQRLMWALFWTLLALWFLLAARAAAGA